MERPLTPPGTVQNLRATVLADGRVELTWSPPAAESPAPSKYFVLRFRVDPQTGARRWAHTAFVPLHLTTHVEAAASGQMRFYVGALGAGGSGKPTYVDIGLPGGVTQGVLAGIAEK